LAEKYIWGKCTLTSVGEKHDGSNNDDPKLDEFVTSDDRRAAVLTFLDGTALQPDLPREARETAKLFEALLRDQITTDASAHFMTVLYCFIKRRTRDLSPRGVLVDEGFQDSGDLLLLTTRES